MPLVSVGIVTFNHKRFIRECIDSVLAQDYERMELVIGDDGSTDGTQEILREYQAKYPHIITLILSRNNQGLTKNCNLVHRRCSGTYVAWVDGDDVVLPGKIGMQVDYMESHPECTISYHNSLIFESDTGKILGYHHNRGSARQGDVKTMFIYGNFNGGSACMIRKEKAPKHGFDERIPTSSDWLYWIETLANGGEIHYIDNVLCRYRRHNDNITKRQAVSSMVWEKALTVLIATRKYPFLLLCYPPMAVDILTRVIHNLFHTPRSMVLIKGKSFLRAYRTPE